MNNPLDQVNVRLSDTREVTLTELLNAWWAHVVRIREEQELASRASWTAHDLVAALLLRDRIAEVLDVESASVRDAAAEPLATADRAFSEMTVEDTGGVVRRFAENLGASGWWWSRLPARGPIRTDLNE